MAKLPILMYHNVSKSQENSHDLTISQQRLEAHFNYLAEQGYTSFHFSELKDIEEKGEKLPRKSVIITFDDVYVNQLELAYPLLKTYELKACFYIPFAYVNDKDDWNTGKENIMSIAQLKSLDPQVVELGFHSFKHNNYKTMSLEEVEEDFQQCDNFILQNGLEVSNVLAYPYGKYPRKQPEKQKFFEELKKQQITYGLRIGNRINRFPFKNPYEVQRIDIKGEDDLKTFKLKLKFGKLRLF